MLNWLALCHACRAAKNLMSCFALVTLVGQYIIPVREDVSRVLMAFLAALAVVSFCHVGINHGFSNDVQRGAVDLIAFLLRM